MLIQSKVLSFTQNKTVSMEAQALLSSYRLGYTGKAGKDIRLFTAMVRGLLQRYESKFAFSQPPRRFLRPLWGHIRCKIWKSWKDPFRKRLALSTSSNEIERVKMAVPLIDFISAYVDLRPVASGGVGRCPFHDDKNPSFGVNKEGNYWQCFSGCGSGSIIDFWMKWNGIEFSQAVKELAELLGVK